MKNYGVLYDGIFGDVSFNFVGNSVDIHMETDYSAYLMNMIRNRLKSLDGDYGNAYKYNIYKNMGLGNTRNLETAMKASVTNMLTFDGLLKTEMLDVAAMALNHKMIIGIKVRSSGFGSRNFLDMIITRSENGKPE